MRQAQFADQIYKQYEIATTTTATAGQLLAYKVSNDVQRLILEAQGDDIYFQFGISSVVVSKTVTSNALADGVFSVSNGHVVELELPSGVNLNYVSVQGKTTTGTAIVRLAQIAA